MNRGSKWCLITSLWSGFPHSEIAGSKLIRSSPTLIAAYHVLHRLCIPRHPPNALKTLDRSHYQWPSSRLLNSGNAVHWQTIYLIIDQHSKGSCALTLKASHLANNVFAQCLEMLIASMVECPDCNRTHTGERPVSRDMMTARRIALLFRKERLPAKYSSQSGQSYLLSTMLWNRQ